MVIISTGIQDFDLVDDNIDKPFDEEISDHLSLSFGSVVDISTEVPMYELSDGGGPSDRIDILCNLNTATKESTSSNNNNSNNNLQQPTTKNGTITITDDSTDISSDTDNNFFGIDEKIFYEELKFTNDSILHDYCTGCNHDDDKNFHNEKKVVGNETHGNNNSHTFSHKFQAKVKKKEKNYTIEYAMWQILCCYIFGCLSVITLIIFIFAVVLMMNQVDRESSFYV